MFLKERQVMPDGGIEHVLPQLEHYVAHYARREPLLDKV